MKQPPASQLILDELVLLNTEGIIARTFAESCPTGNAYAEALWHLLSGHHIMEPEARRIYEDCGYVPFKGFPLQRQEVSEHDRNEAHAQLADIVEKLGIYHAVDLLSTVCWESAELIKKYRQGGMSGDDDKIWRDVSVKLGSTASYLNSMYLTAADGHEGFRFMNPNRKDDIARIKVE